MEERERSSIDWRNERKRGVSIEYNEDRESVGKYRNLYDCKIIA